MLFTRTCAKPIGNEISAIQSKVYSIPGNKSPWNNSIIRPPPTSPKQLIIVTNFRFKTNISASKSRCFPIKYTFEDGMPKFMDIIAEMDEFASVEFNIGDIVRSGLVRSYFISKTKKGVEV